MGAVQHRKVRQLVAFLLDKPVYLLGDKCSLLPLTVPLEKTTSSPGDCLSTVVSASGRVVAMTLLAASKMRFVDR